jgi:hypothetical protein
VTPPARWLGRLNATAGGPDVFQVTYTNLAFQDWHTVFPNASCAVALIDRLTHHAELIPIEGESYRRREAELTRKKRRS